MLIIITAKRSMKINERHIYRVLDTDDMAVEHVVGSQIIESLSKGIKIANFNEKINRVVNATILIKSLWSENKFNYGGILGYVYLSKNVIFFWYNGYYCMTYCNSQFFNLFTPVIIDGEFEVYTIAYNGMKQHSQGYSMTKEQFTKLAILNPDKLFEIGEKNYDV